VCGFIATTGSIDEILCWRLSRRGPTATRESQVGNLLVRHYLLAVNGHVPQPVTAGHGTLFWNGEIYPRPGESDTLWLAKYMAENSGDLDGAVARLCGEFVICWLEDSILRIWTDPFGTKPCYVRADGAAVEVASYASAIGGEPFLLPPNSRFTIDLQSCTVVDSQVAVRHWDWHGEDKTSYDDFFGAIDRAVAKRLEGPDVPVYIPMSGGIDSGVVVAAALESGNRDWETWTMFGCEDLEVIDGRRKWLRENGIRSVVYEPDELDLCLGRREYFRDVEDEAYVGSEESEYHSIFGDFGSYGAYLLARRANKPIAISGQGGDEVFANMQYSKPFQFGRSPWGNMTDGWMRNFLALVDRTGGALGQESRFPLLDFNVVQEFIWLAAGLKNRSYKQPLVAYLKRCEFPMTTKKTLYSFLRGDRESSMEVWGCS